MQNAPDPLPLNRGVFHRLDCAVFNYGLPTIEQVYATKFHSIRGVFQEGQPAFTGSDIRKKSHIQIAVRDPSCILGYFKPQFTHD
jgi:hypothetical protein